MLHSPMDVLNRFPIRKNKVQKREFQNAVCNWAEKQGYHAYVESGSFGVRNIVIGNPEEAQYLLTAHYDTCAAMPVPNWITPCSLWLYLGYQIGLVAVLLFVSGMAGALIGLVWENAASRAALLVYWGILLLLIFGPANKNNANDNSSGVVTLLEIMRTLPENQRKKVCFVLFDLEEAGLIGSASYRKAHKTATEKQLVLNLDCVGDGNHIRMFPTKKLKKDRRKLTSLYKACGYMGQKSILVQEKGNCVYPSDHKNFPYGVGICALNEGKFGLYIGRIHTVRDTVLDINNVNILRAALTSFICLDAAEKKG